MCKLTCVPEHRGQGSILAAIPQKQYVLFLFFVFWVKVSFALMSLIGLCWLTSEPRYLMTLPPASCCHDSVCLGIGDGPSPHTWTTTLQMESSPQPLFIYFNFQTVTFWSRFYEGTYLLHTHTGPHIHIRNIMQIVVQFNSTHATWKYLELSSNLSKSQKGIYSTSLRGPQEYLL